MDFNAMSRRGLLLGAAALGLAACNNAVGQDAPARLDARVDATRNFLLQNYPAVAPMLQSAKGAVVMVGMNAGAQAGAGVGIFLGYLF